MFVKGSGMFRIYVVLTTVLAADAAVASTLAGVVRNPAGKPEANAFVTADNGDRKMAVSVLTDAAGRYKIGDLFAGKYAVRARKYGFSDSENTDVTLGERDDTADLKLQPDAPPHLSTPGRAWLNALPDSPMKALFITQCTICHDQGSPLTHVQRDAETWSGVITQMRNLNESYASLVVKDNGPLSSWLAEQKYGANAAPVDPFAANAHVATTARVTEYSVGDINSWAHDIVVEPKTGTVWIGDYIKDELTSLEPRNGTQKVYHAPFHGSGMHTLSFDRDGYLWITFQLVAAVARFDTASGEWRLYNGFTAGSLNHSFALDSEGYVKKDPKGRLYVSLWGGNRTSLLDPNTGVVKEIPVSGNSYDKPYGIAVDSKGIIWYTKYSENMMGFVDPNTGQGKEWALPKPQSGPHRMHIDNNDNLWIPLSGYGSLLRYNTQTGNQKEIPLPDKDCFPYSARYDSKSDRVWITGNGGNAIYAMDPKTEKFTTFRMPSILSYGRMVSIDYTTGDVWTGLASFPNKLSLRDHSIVVRIHHALDLLH
jgi:virginiamycin B lyase